MVSGLVVRGGLGLGLGLGNLGPFILLDPL